MEMDERSQSLIMDLKAKMIVHLRTLSHRDLIDTLDASVQLEGNLRVVKKDPCASLMQHFLLAETDARAMDEEFLQELKKARITYLAELNLEISEGRGDANMEAVRDRVEAMIVNDGVRDLCNDSKQD